MSANTISSVTENKQLTVRRLLSVALLAIVASIAANLVVYWIAAALFPGVAQFPMLNAVSIIVSTTAFLLLATLVFAVVVWLSSRPARHYRIVAVIALLLSLSAPLSAGTGAMEGASADAATVVTLALMHVIAAAITINLFTTRALEE